MQGMQVNAACAKHVEDESRICERIAEPQEADKVMPHAVFSAEGSPAPMEISPQESNQSADMQK